MLYTMSTKANEVVSKNGQTTSDFDIWKPQSVQDECIRFTNQKMFYSLFGGWDSNNDVNLSNELERQAFIKVNPQIVMKIIGTEGSIIRRVQSTTKTVIVSPHRNQADKVFRITSKHRNPEMAQLRVNKAHNILATLEDLTLGKTRETMRYPDLLPRVMWLLDETAAEVGLSSPVKSTGSSPTTTPPSTPVGGERKLRPVLPAQPSSFNNNCSPSPPNNNNNNLSDLQAGPAFLFNMMSSMAATNPHEFLRVLANAGHVAAAQSTSTNGACSYPNANIFHVHQNKMV